MKERPILFSAPMVRAILEGRKTQTRRVVKLSADGSFKKHWYLERHRNPLFMDPCTECPYGQPGDRLWVRETFCPRSNGLLSIERLQRPFYAADSDNRKPHAWRWRPSMHMPRWASRIDLEIVSRRIERLQAISETDAEAEGVEPQEFARIDDSGNGWTEQYHRGGFFDLWRSIYGAESLTANPFVWVVEFKRVRP